MSIKSEDLFNKPPINTIKVPEKVAKELKNLNNNSIGPLRGPIGKNIITFFYGKQEEYLIEYKEKYFERISRIVSTEKREEFERALLQLIEAFEGAATPVEPTDRPAASVVVNGVSVELDESGLPLEAPALWAERTSGREVSPANFIRDWYAPWIGRGLARAHIKRLDRPLYEAYASWIRPGRHPEDTISLDVAAPHNRIEDDSEALRRRRERERHASAQYRARRQSL